MENKNRRVMRRALCIALALLMLLTVMPLTVFAEETETETFKTGDIIGFGSYPQSEVIDETLKSALTSKAGSTDNWTSYNYYIELVQSDYMKYTDVEYNGAKYRGVYFTQYRPYWTTDSSSTDNSYQDDNGYNTSTIYWFKYEPMKWQVLSYDSTTGEAIVLSKDIIDSQQHYYDGDNAHKIDGEWFYPNNYEHSEIRAWLNGTFYNTAFGTSEKNVIVATMIDDYEFELEYNIRYSMTDNVWLLSYSDVQKADYGFVTDTGYDFNRLAKGTAYALCQGLNEYELSSNGCSGWRLRCGGYDYNYGASFKPYAACEINHVGSVYCDKHYEYDVIRTSIGVRPALTLNLTSEISPSCEHTWQSTEILPTCTDNGSKRTFCENCGGAKIEYIPALGHDFTKKVIDSEHLSLSATKTSPAMYYYSCSRCGTIGTETFAHGEPLQNGGYNKTGDIIAFGSYPQSEVTDETLKNALTAAAGSTDGWTSYGYYSGNEGMEGYYSENEETDEPEQGDYMRYTDIEYNGAKYRGVYFTQYRPCWTYGSSSEDNSCQNNNGYNASTVYWFKYEPMKWQVLSCDSTTGNAVVISKSIIDSQQYYYIDSGTRTIDGATVYPYNYEYSDIRTWLNDTFYNTAFGTSEKNAIVATTLDNSNSTTDNIRLLSFSELQDKNYSLGNEWNEETMAMGTAYAFCQGLSRELEYNGCSMWLMSLADYNNDNGDDSGWGVDLTYNGVRPALTLNLTSGIDPTEPTTEETTVEPIEETTTVPTTEPTTKSGEESTTKSGEESTTEPSEETTTKPSEESTTKSSEESTTKPTTEPTTRPSEESTTKPTTEPTTKTSEESTTKPTTEPTTKPAAEDSDGSTTKGECGHICHKSGIAKFFYKMLRFFWKLFKINKVCDCGFEHY